MLEREFKYFQDHQQELAEQHSGKYLVIKGENVIGVFEKEIDAYFQTQQEHPLGTFLIQFCSADKEVYIQNFTSRAIFA